MSFDLPRTLTLPSGARVTLKATTEATPAEAAEGSPLFSEVIALFEKKLELELALPSKRAEADVLELTLADFHVVRAFLMKAGWVAEDEVHIDCHNCGALLAIHPCAGLETGPWEDDELGDPELDRTAPFGEPLEIDPVPLGRVRTARTLTLAPRTVRQAMPLFTALAKDPLEVDAALVSAMGITALGPVTDRTQVARALEECDDTAFASITDAFLSAHYPLRLAADVFCTKCNARNTVDAPMAREFQPGREPPLDEAASTGAAAAGSMKALPPVGDFVELAHAIAEPLIAAIPGEPAVLVVDDGTPAVDDGGEPLLGSYLPPPMTETVTATRPPTVTIYYKTFEAIDREEREYGRGSGDDAFDWEAELRETIEHELEHHVFFLRGDDPMDEEEHAEIDREALRIVGRAEATRRTFAAFGQSIPDFFVRAWPLVLIAALVLAITLAEGRCTAE